MPFGTYSKIIAVIVRGLALCGNSRGGCKVDFRLRELVLRLSGFLSVCTSAVLGNCRKMRLLSMLFLHLE